MIGAVLLLFVTGTCLASDPTFSCSPFDYEEKFLTKMIRQEFIFEKFKEDMLTLHKKVIDKLADVDNERDKYKSEMQNHAEEFQTLKETLHNEVKEKRDASKAEVKEELEKLKNEFTNIISNNTKQMKNHAEEFQKLKETLQTDVREERDASKADVNEEFEALKNEFTNSMANNTKQMKSHAEEFQKLKDAHDAGTVAFFSKGVSDTTPSRGQIFIFTTPIINEGNGYNKVTGKFTAPVGGLYKFYLQFCLNGGSSFHIYFDIRADNKPVQRGYFRDFDTANCYTADALVRLQTGGTVWVKCYNCGGTMRQTSSEWNTFSGIRIHA